MGEEIGIEFFLATSRRWLPIIDPAHRRWERHENRLDTAHAGLKAKKRSAIEYKIKFNIAAAPILLELALLRRVVSVFAFLDDGHIRLEITVCERLHKRETALET